MSILQVVSIENVRGTPVLFQVPYVVSSVLVAQCSSRAVILSSDGRVFTCIIELPHSMRIVGFPAGVSFPIKNVSISSDGRYVSAVDARGRLFLEDVDGQKPMTRVAAVDQVAYASLADKRVIAVDVTGHVWTCETNATRARRITEKTSIPCSKIAASGLHILTLGKTDRAIRRCSFTQPDTSIPPLLIPGAENDVCIQPFPVTISSGDDFIVSTGDSRAYWLSVKLERFQLKPLDLPDDFRFRDVHISMAGIFFVGDRGEIHRLDWAVVKEKTLRVTPDMLIPFSVAPIPALLKRQAEDQTPPDVRPDKVAFGLVHALFLWVENDPDRAGELKAMMSEISAVLQETHELKTKIATSLPAPTLADTPVARERLLRDALARELDSEQASQAKHDFARQISSELTAVVEAKARLVAERSAISGELGNLRPEVNELQQELQTLRTLKAALDADVANLGPLVADLRAKIEVTGDREKKQRVKEDVAEIDSRLLLMASELKAKKMILARLALERDSVMKIFSQSINN